MRRTPLILALCLSALVAVALPVAAEAKSKKKSKQSVITRVSSMRTEPGRRLTVRGTHFSASRKRNTVIFKGPSGRVAFAKPLRASHHKLVVVLPDVAERLLTRARGVPKPTRMRVRVVVKHRYGKLSRRRDSPLVLSGLGEPAEQDCSPSYYPCLKPDAGDYDCEGGSGDGPNYTGPVTLKGPDVFALDRDGDGTGCD